MFFEQILDDVAKQYCFVKDPSTFIENFYMSTLPSDNEMQGDFKSTAIYQKLKFDIKDGENLNYTKKRFVDGYIEVLNSAGLAAQAIVLSGIDKILADNKDKNKEAIFNYFMDVSYFKKINAILPANENPLDKLSYMISEGNLEPKYLDMMRDTKHFFLETVKYCQRNFKKLDYDLLACSSRQFNYANIEKWIIPYYQEAEDYDADEEVEQAEKEKTEKKNVVKTKAETAEAKVKKTANMSVEDAIEKNFDGLIGLKDVKDAILRKTKLILKLPKKAVDCNFSIVGNPGVGKTTVAEAMSKTFYDAGIIKSPKFIQLNGAGLKGKYVGHTVGQVKDIFSKAKGGTLFLDEVYSLISAEGSDDSYTQEAITQLMLEVENIYKEQSQNADSRTLIIMAGYKDKIAELLDKNVGFKRRFPNTIDIKDYNIEELMAIFNSLMKKDGFKISSDGNKEIEKVLNEQKGKKNFANAGFVRNLLQKVEEYQAERTVKDDMTISVEDVTLAKKDFDEPEERKMGFSL